MKLYKLAAALLAAMSLVAAGCADSNPLAPSTEIQSVASFTGADSVRFAARVETVEQNRRMLTFAGCPDTVIALQECNIVRLKGSAEAPVPFNSIRPSDTVVVYGVREQAGLVHSYRLQICQDTCWDLALRDTIVSIDYAGGWFTVAGRTETIRVDENTYILGSLATRRAMFDSRCDHSYMNAQASAEGFLYRWDRRDTTLSITDLQVGDVVEVKADIVDAGTLLAVFVKLANCSDLAHRCITFEANLASIDLATRIVAFAGQDWVGVVCNGARLTDSIGDPVTLADFTVGDLVAAKGYPLEDGTLKICQMTQL